MGCQPLRYSRRQMRGNGKNSIAYDIMQEECHNARPLIKAKVEQSINEYNFPQLERDEIMYTIADVLTDRLLPEKEEE